MGGLRQTQWLTFGGEPVSGLPPPQLRVAGDGTLTPEQSAAVAHAYRLFKTANQASPAPYYVQHRVLPDGTKVRMESSQGRDRVFAEPPPTGGPKPPILRGYVILPRSNGHTSGWDRGATPDSARAYIAAVKPAITVLPPKIELHVKLQAGAVDWRGANDVRLTWDHNGNNRYATDLWNGVFTGSSGDSASAGVYYKGTKINTPDTVSAAGVFGAYLIIISNTAAYACPSPLGGIEAALARGTFRKEVSPAWTSLAITGTVADARRASAWHFKPDGSVAAAAYAYTSFGVGTWTMTRMRTEAVPMCKRYLTFAIVGGALTCTVSDTAFTCQPIALYVDGSPTPQNGVLTGTGSQALVFGGRRLWGIDFAADDTELVITFDRAGSGTENTDVGVQTRQWAQHWAVNVNGSELLRASYSIDTAGQSHLTDCTGEWIAIHALDARSMAAVVERITSTVPAGSYATLTDVAQTQLAGQIQIVMAGAVVESQPVTIDATLFPRGFFNATECDPRYGFSWRYSITSLGSVFGPDDRHSFYVTYPQISDWLTENIYEALFQSSAMFGRGGHNFFSCYPNQISDFLSDAYWSYGQNITQYAFDFKGNGGGASAYQSLIVGYPPPSTANGDYLTLGLHATSTWYIAQALAIPTQAPLHFLAPTRDLFTNQFFSTIKQIQQEIASVPPLGIDPTYRAKLYTRPTLLDAWTITDLLAPASAAVTADGNTPGAAFHIDPVGVL